MCLNLVRHWHMYVWEDWLSLYIGGGMYYTSIFMNVQVWSRDAWRTSLPTSVSGGLGCLFSGGAIFFWCVSWKRVRVHVVEYRRCAWAGPGRACCCIAGLLAATVRSLSHQLSSASVVLRAAPLRSGPSIASFLCSSVSDAGPAAMHVPANQKFLACEGRETYILPRYATEYILYIFLIV